MLDVARGIAAFTVVLWHYQHFWFIAPLTLPDDFVRQREPWYRALSWAYDYGFEAVQLFFVLSGYIFFAVYLDAIRERRVDLRAFFVFRLSRLYPLYVVTLLFCAAGQLAARGMGGEDIVYNCNDARHFVMHLLMAAQGGLGEAPCMSFNGPVWSVSVEMLLYAVFFGFALVAPRGRVMRVAVVVGVMGVVWVSRSIDNFAQPLLGFFLGGLVFVLGRPALTGAALVAGAASLYAAAGASDAVLTGAYGGVIALLVAVQRARPEAGTSGQVLGDVSYSVYLLHFPVQIAMILLTRMGVLRLRYEQVWVLAGFLAVTFGLGMLSYYRFERPMQGWIRRRWLGEVRGHAKMATS